MGIALQVLLLLLLVTFYDPLLVIGSWEKKVLSVTVTNWSKNISGKKEKKKYLKFKKNITKWLRNLCIKRHSFLL